jgi:hypothetical protein
VLDRVNDGIRSHETKPPRSRTRPRRDGASSHQRTKYRAVTQQFGMGFDMIQESRWSPIVSRFEGGKCVKGLSNEATSSASNSPVFACYEQSS